MIFGDYNDDSYQETERAIPKESFKSILPTNYNQLTIHQLVASYDGVTNEKKITLTDGKEFSIKKKTGVASMKDDEDARIRMDSLKNPVFVSMKLGKPDQKVAEHREKVGMGKRNELVAPDTCKVCNIF